jgi:hypothetical protein
MLRNLINQDVPILTNAGAPTSGAAGTYFNQAGKGAIIIDTTNGNIYINVGTKAVPIWMGMASGNIMATLAIVNVAASQAIPVRPSMTYVVTKAGIAALTIAAPTAGAPGTGDDGVNILITSSTAFAHTVTFTGNTLQSGAAGVLTATFNNVAGASIDFMAFNGKWILQSANGVSLS